jgi:predicted nucleic acid-binding Zn ribbon protein
MEQYRNQDGTYTSPKNGKTYKSLKAFIAHWNYNGRSGFENRLYNVGCKFCKKDVICSNIKRHEINCYLNPDNLKQCLVCGSAIKNHKTSKGTCSRACSNVFFKNVRKRKTLITYRSICFDAHGKSCVVCGENKIVTVHHINENHNDHRKENLVPLCPTHHQYMHSRYKGEIQPFIDKFLEKISLPGPDLAIDWDCIAI